MALERVTNKSIPPNKTITMIGDAYYQWRGIPSGYGESRDSWEVATIQTLHSCLGERTPGYRKLVKSKKFIAPTAYIRSDSHLEDFIPSGTFLWSEWRDRAAKAQVTCTYHWYGGFGYSAVEEIQRSLEAVDLADLMNMAAGRMNKNANVGPFLAQINQTRTMIIKAVQRFHAFVSKAVQSIRSSGFELGTVYEVLNGLFGLTAAQVRVKLSSTPKRLANLYLELIYGWRPLLSDLEMISKQLRRISEGTDILPPWVRGSADTSRAIDVSGEVVRVFGDTGEPGKYLGQRAEIVLTYGGRIATSYNATAYGEPIIPRRLFVFPPFSTAWDILPFSFVVDWVFNLSSYLKALEVQLYVKPLAGSMGSLILTELKGSYKGRVVGDFNINGSGQRIDSFSMSGDFLYNAETRARSKRSPVAELPKVLRLGELSKHPWEIVALLLSSNPARRNTVLV